MTLRFLVVPILAALGSVSPAAAAEDALWKVETGG